LFRPILLNQASFGFRILIQLGKLLKTIILGAYTENPSDHKRTPVGAASSREIK
jgi:hypothetical protein